MKEQKPAANPGVRVKDSVYFKHPELGVTHGVVAAVGEHGFTADSDEGNECGVPWGDFVGHRKRAKRTVKVIDHGEDGMMLEEEDGSRVYFHGSLADLQAGGDELNKSFPGGVSLAGSQQFDSLALTDKSRIVADLAAAGFVVSADYVRATFGEQFTARAPEPTRGIFGWNSPNGR